jgi:hypothetical protein
MLTASRCPRPDNHGREYGAEGGVLVTVAGDSSGVTKPGLIAMWAAPRSRSTAFFRYMLEHGGLVALHEPFGNIADHGSTVVNGHLISDDAELITTLRGLAGTATVFFKDTTDNHHQAVLADQRFLTEVTNTFLIRAPAEIAASYYALYPDMKLHEVGLEHAYEIHQAILAAGGPQPVVVDSADLIADPAATMAAYCSAVGVPFSRAALRWAPGDRKEWRQTARWHTRASESTGFAQSATSYETTAANNAMLARFSAHHEPFYRALRAHRIAIS